MTGTMFKYSSLYCREHVREQHVSVIKNRSLLVGLINYKPICIFNDTFSVEQNNSNWGTNKSIHMQHFVFLMTHWTLTCMFSFGT